MCVILRPANRPGLRTAAGKATGAAPRGETLDRIARAIEAAAAATGLAPRLLAFQASREGLIHEDLAHRLTVPADVVTPSVGTVLEEVGRSRMVVTMRYHGAVAALLHGRPTVMLNYSPKMASLAGEAGGWAPLLSLEQLDAGPLETAVLEALDSPTRPAAALAELRSRLPANDAALDELTAGDG